MARRAMTATAAALEIQNEFDDIVARSMPTAINGDKVLTGMARQALDRGIATSGSFDEALLAVFKAGIRLGRETPVKKAGRPRGSKNAANGAEPMPQPMPQDEASTFGSARG